MQKANKFEYIYWEDYKNGMYDPPLDEFKEIELAIRIFNDFNLFEMLCLKVINQWEVSCLENLTNKRINRIAWMGQSALNIDNKIKEISTKKAWKKLDSDTKNKLNSIAYKTILKYEKTSKGLYNEVGNSLF